MLVASSEPRAKAERARDEEIHITEDSPVKDPLESDPDECDLSQQRFLLWEPGKPPRRLEYADLPRLGRGHRRPGDGQERHPLRVARAAIVQNTARPSGDRADPPARARSRNSSLARSRLRPVRPTDTPNALLFFCREGRWGVASAGYGN